MLMLVGLMGLVAVGGIALLEDTPGEETEPGDDDTLSDNNIDTGEPNVVTNLILPGDDLDNDITGGPGDDQINGYAGDDEISGGGGDDTLHGGAGSDVISGDTGNDTLHGEHGDDILSGDAGDDQIFGHNENDTLTGDAGDDEMHGGLGDDTLTGGTGDDALHGGEGDDHLQGDEGQDNLFGGWGDDWVSGLEDEPTELVDAPDANRDYLNGGGGDDTIVAGESDVVTAGSGGDTVVLGDWIAGKNAATLMDFDIEEDTLLMVCDLNGNSDPVIEVNEDPQLPGVSHIMLDGSEIATVHSDGSLSAQDIMLIDYADAPILRLNA